MITALAYSPDGTLLATAGLDHRVRLWESGSGRSLGTLTADHWGTITSLAFTRDGTRLYSTSLGALFEHPIAQDLATAAVCARAGRDLTTAERTQHLKEFPTLAVCAHPGKKR